MDATTWRAVRGVVKREYKHQDPRNNDKNTFMFFKFFLVFIFNNDKNTLLLVFIFSDIVNIILNYN